MGRCSRRAPDCGKGTPLFSYSYRWEACEASGANCSIIPGATASTYRPVTSQIGGKLRAIVTATNSLGSATATRPTTKIKPGPPVSITTPTVSGSLQEGQTLSASAGEWGGTGPLAFAYQWLRCTPWWQLRSDRGRNRLDLPSRRRRPRAQSRRGRDSLQLARQRLRYLVGKPGRPRHPAHEHGSSQHLRAIAGRTASQRRLWNGTGSPPISYAYQWQLCNALGKACEDISGATTSSLPLDPSEIGKTLAVVVTATNAAGSTSATSSVTSAIAGLCRKTRHCRASPERCRTAAAERGVGHLDRAANRSPMPTSGSLQRPRQILRRISERTGSSLTLDPSEIGKTLALVVTATNAAGSTSATSSVTSLIAGSCPKTRAAGHRRRAAGRLAAERRDRHLERHRTDLIRLPVAAVQRARQSLRRHLRRHRLDAQTQPVRHRQDRDSRCHRDERRRLDVGDELGHEPDRRRPAEKHGAADDRWVAEKRPAPQRDQRNMDGQRTDLLQLPVAAVPAGQLQRHR